jgi:hypothetical protein
MQRKPKPHTTGKKGEPLAEDDIATPTPTRNLKYEQFREQLLQEAGRLPPNPNPEIPEFFNDELSKMFYPFEEGSHEGVPPIPRVVAQRLLVALVQISSGVLGTTRQASDLIAALDKAYSLFAQAFVDNNYALTPGLLEVDLPNMVFNFALRENWFPSVVLHGDKSQDYELLSPTLYPIDRILPAVFTAKSEQTIGWFRKAILPSVSKWKATLIEAQIQPTTDLTEHTVEDLKKLREDLLNDYKRRVKDDKGKPYSNYSLYNAKNSGICKPEFYKWLDGLLSVTSMTCTNFERFLKANEPPKRRETKKPPKN